MKLCNIIVEGKPHVAVVRPADGVLVDAAAVGFACSIDDVYAGAGLAELQKIAADAGLPAVEDPVYGSVRNHVDKVICVALNYMQHSINTGWKVPDYPQFFNKYADCVVPCGASIELPPYEDSYDYEAEIVAIVGKDSWQVPLEEAKDHIFGYTCGNDLSCRGVQKRTPQWMLGKNFPGFAPAGPFVVTADEFDPDEPHAINDSNVDKAIEEYDRLADFVLERRKEGRPFNFFHFYVDMDSSPCLAKRALGCGAGVEYVAVAPNGDIYPCHQFVGDNDFLLGNVLKTDEEGNVPLNNEIRQRFASCNIFTKEKCSHCWAKYYCSGGCAANAHKLNGSITEPPEVSCKLLKKRTEIAIGMATVKDSD